MAGDQVEEADGTSPFGNRRATFRLATALDVQVRSAPDTVGTDAWARDATNGERVLRTVTEDISVGGLRFRAPNTLPAGSDVSISLTLNGARHVVKGSVRRASADPFG